jgi:antitoxin component of MazEF toxin-antitoxin module
MTERKVITMGGRSFLVTLPMEFCKKIGVTAKTVFNIEMENDKFTLTRVK